MGFFGRARESVPPHPRKEPRYDLPLTLESLETVFAGCADFSKRNVRLAGDGEKVITLCYISGMVRMERVSDYVLRPLAQDSALADCPDMAELMAAMEEGALYNLGVERRSATDRAAFDLVEGNCLLLFPGETEVLSFNVGTEEKRSISEPENETVLKGPRDSFVESVRTNTSLCRRHLKAPELRLREQIVGRQSVTTVDVLYLEGVVDPSLVERVQARLERIDIDAVLSTGNIEEYIIDETATAFPLVQYTERPDRF